MKLSSTDYLLTRFAHATPGTMKMLGDLETDLLGDRLASIRIDRPVFITGLARSGTTLLLDLLSRLPQVATHQYRDFPFLFVPFAWNRLQERIGRRAPPIERPHRDGIRITRDSPEAFEEPIWAHFFDVAHDPRAVHRLTADDRVRQFDTFFLEHVRKVLLLRGGTRYVSKGNYNVTRIEYLADLLPDARFVVPVRHPVAQAESLVRQHALFSQYSSRDRRIADYLRAAGHFEFGPQRVPINVDAAEAHRIAEAWAVGSEAAGYAVMWRSIYGHARSLADTGSRLRGRIEFLRYEDLCEDPARALRRISQFCELEEGSEDLITRLPAIAARTPDSFRLSSEQRARVWDLVAPTARSFSYAPERNAA